MSSWVRNYWTLWAVRFELCRPSPFQISAKGCLNAEKPTQSNESISSRPKINVTHDRKKKLLVIEMHIRCSESKQKNHPQCFHMPSLSWWFKGAPSRFRPPARTSTEQNAYSTRQDTLPVSFAWVVLKHSVREAVLIVNRFQKFMIHWVYRFEDYTNSFFFIFYSHHSFLLIQKNRLSDEGIISVALFFNKVKIFTAVLGI